jgi:hypothetical protein
VFLTVPNGFYIQLTKTIAEINAGSFIKGNWKEYRKICRKKYM